MAVTMPVPVFAAVGSGMWGAVQELRARPELRLVPSPRHASVLLVAGTVAPDHRVALDRVHDQMPHPRAVVRWGAGEGSDEAGAITAALVDAFDRLRHDPSTSTPDRLPDEEPNEWRGVGPFGQGGEGMMGGTPYGRPMAMTGDDRDGLSLDQLHLRLGPFLEWLPPGVVLDVTMQGEVLQDVVPSVARAQAAGSAPNGASGESPAGTVDPIRSDLRWLALALHVHGLDALSTRAARLAATGRDDRRAVSRLCRSVRRSGLLWGIGGVGPVHGAGDAADRWRARLARLEAGDLSAGCDESPIGTSWSTLAAHLVGLTLTDAVTTVVSMHDRLRQPAGEPTAS